MARLKPRMRNMFSTEPVNALPVPSSLRRLILVQQLNQHLPGQLFPAELGRHILDRFVDDQLGVDAAALFQDDVDKDRTRHGHGPLDEFPCPGTVVDGHGGDAVGLGNPAQVGTTVTDDRGLLPAAEVHVLELAHHAQAVVVEHDDLDRQPVLHDGVQVLDVDLDAAVPGDGDDRAVRRGLGGAHGRRQGEAHGPHAARDQHALPFFQPEGLGGPHLVLPHIQGDDVPFRAGGGETLHEQVGIDRPGFGRLHASGIFLFVAVDHRQPDGDIRPGSLGELFVKRLQEGFQVALQGDIDLDLGLQFDRIDVHMHLLGGPGKGLRAGAGLARVEPRAEDQQEVAVGQGQVAVAVAVGADHAHELRVIVADGVQSHQRTDHWDAAGCDQGLQFSGGTGGPHSAPGQDQRAFGRCQQANDLVQLFRPLGFSCQQLPVFLAVIKAGQLVRFDLRPLDVHGDVQQDRAGAAALCQIDRLFQLIADAGRFGHQVGVFGQGLDDTDDIRFLETDLADGTLELVFVGVDLAGDEQTGDRVEPAAADTGDHVQGPRAAGGHGDAQSAVDPGIGLGGKGAGLFVMDGDAVDVVPVNRGVDQVRDGAADELEDLRDPLLDDKIYDIIREFHERSHTVAS